MRAEVKRFLSHDLPDGRSVPEDPTNCCVGMAADLGPVGEEGADIFYFEVCTPNALGARLADGRPSWTRGLLLTPAFDWDDVEAALQQYVGSIDGKDWQEVALKLSRFLLWEFEDITPYRPR